MFRIEAVWGHGAEVCARKKPLFWSLARFAVELSVVATVCGCGARTSEPDVDGQSHWWQLCAEDTDCAEGFQCACGACTRPCDDADICGTTEGVRCSLRAGFCKEEFLTAEALVCQVACEQPSDCPGTLTCHSGLCVNAQSVTSVSPSDLTSGQTSALPVDGGLTPLCGDPPTECPPPPPDWCGFHGDTALPPDLVEYWSSFCDAGLDASDASLSLSVCGDGILQSDEVCDDGNTLNGDGCTGTCDAVEVNFDCNKPGQPCHMP